MDKTRRPTWRSAFTKKWSRLKGREGRQVGETTHFWKLMILSTTGINIALSCPSTMTNGNSLLAESIWKKFKYHFLTETSSEWYHYSILESSQSQKEVPDSPAIFLRILPQGVRNILLHRNGHIPQVRQGSLWDHRYTFLWTSHQWLCSGFCERLPNCISQHKNWQLLHSYH